MVISFAASAIITAAILIFIVWNAFTMYFSSYAAENMEVIAGYIAGRVSEEYGEMPALRAIDYEKIMRNLNMQEETGLMILDEEGEIVFNSINLSSGLENSTPDEATKVAIAPIVSNNAEIGSVRIWVYGSDVLMSNVDVIFRNNTFEALVIAALLSIMLTIFIGLLFSNRITAPLRRITTAANKISEGDLSARTGLRGSNEIAQLGQQFDRMAESIENDRKLEIQLTSDVAHELRTPLMAVQATVEAMMDGVYKTDPEHLALVDNEVKRLSRLVDALLKLSRIEKRSQPLKEEITDLGEMINDIINTHEVFVTGSGLQIQAHVKGKVRAVCDKDLIRQAISNLVSNAVRYTPEGGRIDVYAYEKLKNKDNNAFTKTVVVEVKDTGIGIADDEKKLVFSRFWRSDSRRNDKSGGLGVGLAVVKEIVDRHNGTIGLESELGKGSTFRITLPGYDEEESRREAREAMKAFERAQSRQSTGKEEG